MSRGVGIFLSHNSVTRRAGAWTVEDASPYEDYYGGTQKAARGRLFVIVGNRPSRTSVPTSHYSSNAMLAR